MLYLFNKYRTAVVHNKCITLLCSKSVNNSQRNSSGVTRSLAMIERKLKYYQCVKLFRSFNNHINITSIINTLDVDINIILRMFY